MAVRMNEVFRARLLEFQTQKALDEAEPLLYLTNAFNQGNMAMAEALAELCRKRTADPEDKDSSDPGQRFVNMVHRDRDVRHWADFLRHEQKREGSNWRNANLKELPEKLEEWFDSLATENPRDIVLGRVTEALLDKVSDLIKEERQHIGLRAFREMLWRLRSGGE